MLPFKENTKGGGMSTLHVTSKVLPVCGHRRCHRVAQPLYQPHLGENTPWVHIEQPGQVWRRCVTHQERKTAAEMCMKEVKVTRFIPWVGSWLSVSEGCQGYSQNTGAAFCPSSTQI